MPMLNVTWRLPARRTPLVVVVIIHLIILRFVPADLAPLVLASLTGRLLVAEPIRSLRRLEEGE